MNSDERSRLTRDEFMLVILGCFIRSWGVTGFGALNAIPWLACLSDKLNDAVKAGSEEAKAMITGSAEFSWFNILLKASRNYLQLSTDEQASAEKLVNIGRHQSEKFLGYPRCPLFGLLTDTDHSVTGGYYIGLLEEEHRRIAYLRDFATERWEKSHFNRDHAIIRYKHLVKGVSRPLWQFATAVPLKRLRRKRKLDNDMHEDEIHVRWLCDGAEPNLRRSNPYRRDTSSRQESNRYENGKSFTIILTTWVILNPSNACKLVDMYSKMPIQSQFKSRIWLSTHFQQRCLRKLYFMNS